MAYFMWDNIRKVRFFVMGKQSRVEVNSVLLQKRRPGMLATAAVCHEGSGERPVKIQRRPGVEILKAAFDVGLIEFVYQRASTTLQGMHKV